MDGDPGGCHRFTERRMPGGRDGSSGEGDEIVKAVAIHGGAVGGLVEAPWSRARRGHDVVGDGDAGPVEVSPVVETAAGGGESGEQVERGRGGVALRADGGGGRWVGGWRPGRWPRPGRGPRRPRPTGPDLRREDAERLAGEWAQAWFDLEEVRAWLHAGAGVNDGPGAAALRDLGVPPRLAACPCLTMGRCGPAVSRW